MKKLMIAVLAILVMVSCKKDESPTGSCETCTHTLTGDQKAGTVAASTQGKHTLTMQYAKSDSPFPDGTTGEFEITADNKLIVKIDDSCITLANPYTTSPSEVSYVDNCKHNLEFAVSEANGGGLNEINIGADGKFLGQFH